MNEPTKNPASGDSRKASSAAISSARPGRPIGMGYVSPSDDTKSQVPAVIAVSTKPGAIALSRIPLPIQSSVVAWRRTHRPSASLEMG